MLPWDTRIDNVILDKKVEAKLRRPNLRLTRKAPSQDVIEVITNTTLNRGRGIVAEDSLL